MQKKVTKTQKFEYRIFNDHDNSIKTVRIRTFACHSLAIHPCEESGAVIAIIGFEACAFKFKLGSEVYTRHYGQ